MNATADDRTRGVPIIPEAARPLPDLRRLTLWHTIDWYASSIGTEHEKRERKVLDNAIDAALADRTAARVICSGPKGETRHD